MTRRVQDYFAKLAAAHAASAAAVAAAAPGPLNLTGGLANLSLAAGTYASLTGVGGTPVPMPPGSMPNLGPGGPVAFAVSGPIPVAVPGAVPAAISGGLAGAMATVSGMPNLVGGLPNGMPGTLASGLPAGGPLGFAPAPLGYTAAALVSPSAPPSYGTRIAGSLHEIQRSMSQSLVPAVNMAMGSTLGKRLAVDNLVAASRNIRRKPGEPPYAGENPPPPLITQRKKNAPRKEWSHDLKKLFVQCYKELRQQGIKQTPKTILDLMLRKGLPASEKTTAIPLTMRHVQSHFQKYVEKHPNPDDDDDAVLSSDAGSAPATPGAPSPLSLSGTLEAMTMLANGLVSTLASASTPASASASEESASVSPSDQQSGAASPPTQADESSPSSSASLSASTPSVPPPTPGPPVPTPNPLSLSAPASSNAESRPGRARNFEFRSGPGTPVYQTPVASGGPENDPTLLALGVRRPPLCR
eukprot:TRINITY_DN1276_c0_g1_i2.p1 TRINITY_DN1276_c0_g1~~TRINITY_DN1276_c0_g1_i2.p1  ORF type:complete len:471 (-),score=119.94 TRINITY_DN1276_c0_g1_i2:450-1862(-)